ncbi:MAG: pitrilysin family protein [Bacteroidota bacterium]|nr:pitrilysin family protein [Bacteroidota bacterium]MDP4196577.1 pitrilysin family protein [Bacteroidota bacterium]
MRFKSILILSFLLFASFSLFGKGKNSAKILPYEISQHKMSNGLNVVTVKFDSPGLASFFVVMRVGSRNEVEPGVTGFAHFFEHMMFRGTEKYPSAKYDEVLKLTGAGANANTSLDRTIYHMTGDASKLETMFELESDRFQNLKYSEHDFKTEAGAIKGEYTKNIASPYEQLSENVVNTAFDKHTYKHTTMGFLKDIIDMPNQYQYSLKFFDRYYRPEYATIVVVGDVTPEKVNSLAEKYFGSWKKGSYSVAIPSEPKQKETRYTHLQNSGIPPYLELDYKGPGFSDKSIDVPALDILTTILFSPNSALYKKLVIEEQKVRAIDGGTESTRDPYLVSFYASMVKKEDMQYVKDEIIKAIENIKTNGVDKKLLDDTKSNIKYSFAMRTDSPESIANSLSRFIYLTGDPESLNRFFALYDKVTVEDLRKVAKKYLAPSALTIATISPDAQGGVK